MKNGNFKIVLFNENDVIATSGKLLSIAGTFNGTPGDATFTFNGVTYYNTEHGTDPIINKDSVDEYFGTGTYENGKIKNGILERTIQTLAGVDAGKSDKTGKGLTTNSYNHTWVWDGSQFTLKQ